MSVSARPTVTELEATHHGGLDYAALGANGISPTQVLDFSVSVNPFGPPPEVREAVARAALDRYPDTHASALREQLANVNGVEPGEVLVTNGVSQAIWLLALAYIRPNDIALELSPTFGEYRVACELMGAQVESCWARTEDSFHPNIEEVAARVRDDRPRMVWLCNPNNPTGRYLTEGKVHALLQACVRAGSLLVVDEAYVNFVESTWSPIALLESSHLVLLRSMTKDYALAGLRLGYVLAPPEVAKVLGRVQPPWSVNAVAQEAGLAALESEDYYRATWRELHHLTGELRRSLLELGHKVLPTDTNYLLARIEDSAGLRQELWTHRILVRDCSSFGLPNYIRVGTRLEKDNHRLVYCIRDLAAPHLEGAFNWAR